MHSSVQNARLHEGVATACSQHEGFGSCGGLFQVTTEPILWHTQKGGQQAHSCTLLQTQHLIYQPVYLHSIASGSACLCTCLVQTAPSSPMSPFLTRLTGPHGIRTL